MAAVLSDACGTPGRTERAPCLVRSRPCAGVGAFSCYRWLVRGSSGPDGRVDPRDLTARRSSAAVRTGSTASSGLRRSLVSGRDMWRACRSASGARSAHGGLVGSRAACDCARCALNPLSALPPLRVEPWSSSLGGGPESQTSVGAESPAASNFQGDCYERDTRQRGWQGACRRTTIHDLAARLLLGRTAPVGFRRCWA